MKVIPDAAPVSRYTRLIVCSLVYQAVWFACVVAATRRAWIWVPPVTVAGFTLMQLCFWKSARWRTMLLMATALVAGGFLDSGLTLSGVLSPARSVLPWPLTPVWLLSLWAGFGVYIALGLDLMYGRARMAALGGAIGGPLAYRAGVTFGAVELGIPVWRALVILSMAWAVAFMVLIWLAGRLADGINTGTGNGEQSAIRVKANVGSRVSVVIFMLLAFAPPSLALKGDRSAFADVYQIDGIELRLRGVGRLRRYLITGCDIALYTAPGVTRANLFQGTPKALEFRYFTRIRGEQFARAASEGLRRNLDEATYARFEADILTMGAMYTDVGRDDRYRLFFIPGMGTVLERNGVRQGLIAGNEFADIYFRIWLGAYPIDDDLFEGMIKTVQ